MEYTLDIYIYGTHRSQVILLGRPIIGLFCCTWLDSEMKFSLLLVLVKMPEIVKIGFTLSRRWYFSM